MIMFGVLIAIAPPAELESWREDEAAAHLAAPRRMESGTLARREAKSTADAPPWGFVLAGHQAEAGNDF